MVKFQTAYDRAPKIFVERGGGKLITEQSGYITPKQQIEAMINAGERLNAFRKEFYDFSSADDIDDSFSDPTRDVGFDLADASRISKELDSKFKASKLGKKRKDDKSANGNEGDSKVGNPSSEPAPQNGG